MANPARGTQLAIEMQDEATWATDPTGGAATIKLPIVSTTLAGAQNVLDSNTLLASRLRGTPARGNINVAGQIVTELSGQAYGKLFKHLLGLDTPTGGPNYVHTITPQDLPVAFMLDIDHGSVVAGSYRYEHLNGVRVKGVTIELRAEGLQLATWDLLGAKQTFSASVFYGSPTDLGHTPFYATEMTLKEGGSTIAYVSRVQVQVQNNLEEDKYAIGGAGMRRSAPEGFADVSGEIECFFEDTALLQKAILGTDTSLQAIMQHGTGDGSAGNEYLEIYLEHLQYARNSARTTGPGSKSLVLPFRCYRASSAGPIKVVIKNTQATV